VQRIGRDHGAGQLQVGQQRLEPGNFTRSAVDLALAEYGAGGVVHRGQQMDAAAVAVGPPQGLAVDRDRPPPLRGATVTVSQPRAEHGGQRGGVHPGEGPADGGLGRHHPPVGAITTSAERGTHRLRGVGGPLGDGVIDRAPVRTAAAAMARIATSGCRLPRPRRGSPIVAR